METAITSAILIAVMILAVVGLSSRVITTQAVISDATRTMQEREGERLRTNLTPLNTTTSNQGDSVQVTLKNTGSTKLADFKNWDVILQYSDGTNRMATWYPYGTDVNQWHQEIFMIASPPSPEVIEPGILNPGEEMVVTINVSPGVGPGTTNLATVSTPNGVTATTVFTH
jgi:archaeal flagellar protein FlaF